MNWVPTPYPGRVFAAARHAAIDRANRANLSGRQIEDLEKALLDLERDVRLTEGIVARLARQGVPVSQLLRVSPRTSLIGDLRKQEPGMPQSLGIQLARRMAAGGWQIAPGNASPSPYPKRGSTD